VQFNVSSSIGQNFMKTPDVPPALMFQDTRNWKKENHFWNRTR